MEDLIKQCGHVKLNEIASHFAHLVIPAKITTVKQLFKGILADDADYIPKKYILELMDNSFCEKLKTHIQENVLSQKIKIKEEEEEVKVKSEELPMKYKTFRFHKYEWKEEHIKHMPTYRNEVPSANVSEILKPLFEKRGFVFTPKDWQLLWNVLLLFTELQTAILNECKIIPKPNQANAPKHIVGFGSLNDFLSMDTIKLKNKKWGDSVGYNGFNFIGRPWEFQIGETVFREINDSSISLFEQLLIFGNTNSPILNLNHTIFDITVQPIISFCYHLCLSSLFGKQILLQSGQEPILYYTFTVSNPIPDIHDYFLSLFEGPISVSVDLFKPNEIFSGIIPDSLAHPLPKKTYVWIQKEEAIKDTYRMFIFPKTPLKNNNNHKITKNIICQNPDMVTRRIFSGCNDLTRTVCKIDDDVLSAINTSDGYIYKVITNKNHHNPLIWLCTMTTTITLHTMRYLAKVWNKTDCKNLILSDSEEELEDSSCMLMNTKTAVQKWSTITVGFVFILNCNNNTYHYFDPPPKYGYIIVAQNDQINWAGIQYLFTKRNPFLKSIPFAQAILDNCSVNIKIEQGTLERENQDREFAMLLKSEITPTEEITDKKRRCEKSILLDQHWKKKTQEKKREKC